ncbi:MAG: hypothetical protein ACP5OZ_00425 [Candidatus Woesearchaeota archaeon]
MSEYLKEAYQELKRAEHSLFVSLKYTRTIEVISSIISRLVSFYDKVIDALIELKSKKGTEIEIPKSPGLKGNIVKELFSEDAKIREEIEFYFLLRAIARSKKTAFSEYRKHVAIMVEIEGKDLKIDIEKITEYYRRAQSFFGYVLENYFKLDMNYFNEINDFY